MSSGSSAPKSSNAATSVLSQASGGFHCSDSRSRTPKRKRLSKPEESWNSTESSDTTPELDSSSAEGPNRLSAGAMSKKRFVGVRQRPSGRWVAEIKDTTQKIRLWLGTFDSAEEGAKAYDSAARALRGNNTRTNFVPALQSSESSIPASKAARLIFLRKIAASKSKCCEKDQKQKAGCDAKKQQDATSQVDQDRQEQLPRFPAETTCPDLFNHRLSAGTKQEHDGTLLAAENDAPKLEEGLVSVAVSHQRHASSCNLSASSSRIPTFDCPKPNLGVDKDNTHLEIATDLPNITTAGQEVDKPQSPIPLTEPDNDTLQGSSAISHQTITALEAKPITNRSDHVSADAPHKEVARYGRDTKSSEDGRCRVIKKSGCCGTQEALTIPIGEMAEVEYASSNKSTVLELNTQLDKPVLREKDLSETTLEVPEIPWSDFAFMDGLDIGCECSGAYTSDFDFSAEAIDRDSCNTSYVLKEQYMSDESNKSLLEVPQYNHSASCSNTFQGCPLPTDPSSALESCCCLSPSSLSPQDHLRHSLFISPLLQWKIRDRQPNVSIDISMAAATSSDRCESSSHNYKSCPVRRIPH
ncbi:uncharacterized protein [Physcomitrium patens]|uniref:AP2/ERF domain-containing protein n=1 Tax=Physcomitrium patens TaxID=3218 RepID=A0A7I4FHT4_PHYPA|nr:uncharacterized protein LOC112277174 [Physcomitrium patens]XP_024364998.1 uncharacterized protein LOC112277174 [Physcomitrium patens]XP_024364999.1 uncharacterized protein LOC112277174 [Physcomitrium patens]|eukprot:XP_024364997.1 uncharacterized protein LOC112277174 [Physcomitrella patens]